MFVDIAYCRHPTGFIWLYRIDTFKSDAQHIEFLEKLNFGNTSPHSKFQLPPQNESLKYHRRSGMWYIVGKLITIVIDVHHQTYFVTHKILSYDNLKFWIGYNEVTFDSIVD